MPGGASQKATAVGASSSSWGHNTIPKLPGDDTNVVRPSQKGSSAQQPSYNAQMETSLSQPVNHDPHGAVSASQGSGHDQLVDDKLSSPGNSDLHRLDSPDSAEHVQHESNAHDINRMVEHLSGHLPDSADEDAPEAEDKGGANEEDAVWERKQSSMTDIDVVN